MTRIRNPRYKVTSVPEDKQKSPEGDLIGEDGDKEAAVMDKDRADRLAQENIRAQKELEKAMDAQMNKYRTAMHETFNEIMYGARLKKEEGDKS